MASEYLKRLAQRSRERREEDENVVRSVTRVSKKSAPKPTAPAPSITRQYQTIQSENERQLTDRERENNRLYSAYESEIGDRLSKAAVRNPLVASKIIRADERQRTESAQRMGETAAVTSYLRSEQSKIPYTQVSDAGKLVKTGDTVKVIKPGEENLYQGDAPALGGPMESGSETARNRYARAVSPVAGSTDYNSDAESLWEKYGADAPEIVKRQIEDIEAITAENPGAIQTGELYRSVQASLTERRETLAELQKMARDAALFEKYGSVPEREDFAQYGGYPAASYPEFGGRADEILGGDELIRPEAAESATYDDKVLKNRDFYAGLSEDDRAMYRLISNEIGSDEATGYALMDGDERGIFRYLYNRDGEDAAREYYESISEELTKRQGQREKAAVEAIENPLVRKTQELAGAYGAGLSDFGTAVHQTFSRSDAVPLGAVQHQAEATAAEKTGFDRVLYDATRAVGGMTPALAAGAIAGAAGLPAGAVKWIGQSVMGLNAYGNSYRSALESGHGEGEATAYALLSAASEVATEKALSGISALGGALPDTVKAKLGQNVGSAALRFALDMGVNMGSEGFEEVLQNEIDLMLRNAVLGEQNDLNPLTEENLYTFLSSAFSAGVLELPGTALSARGKTQLARLGQTAEKSGNLNRMIELGLAGSPELRDAAARAYYAEPSERRTAAGELLLRTSEEYGDDVTDALLRAPASDAAPHPELPPVFADESRQKYGTKTGENFVALPVFKDGKPVEDYWETAEPVKVGRGTVIYHPYTGGNTPKNVNVQQKTAPVSIDSGAVEKAASEIVKARESGQGFKGAIKRTFGQIFDAMGGARKVRLDGVTFRDNPYDVTLNKNLVGKVISDPHLSSEKLSVLYQLDDAIRGAEYVGSGEYNKNKPKAQNVIRYDYFENQIEIGGEPYLMTFDVEVYHGTNNMRTYRTIKEIDLTPMEGNVTPSKADAATHGSRTRGLTPEKSSLFSDTNISQSESGVNTQSMREKSGVSTDRDSEDSTGAFGDDSVGAARPLSTEEKAQLYDDYVREYGAIPKGENPVRDVDVPRKTGKNRHTRQGARTFIESAHTPEAMVQELKAAVADDLFAYERLSNKEAQDTADSTLYNKGFDGALEEWNAAVIRGENKVKDIVLGETLYLEAAKRGDLDLATQIAAEVSEMATDAGRVVQAMRMLKKTTPAGKLYGIESAVEKINRNLREKYKRKFKRGKMQEVSISNELKEKLLGAETNEQADAILSEIERHIAEQLPSTIGDKMDALRYFAMLSNPRTHIRNILGNVAFGRVVDAKDLVGAALEKAFLPQDERSKAVLTPKDKALRDFATKDFETVRGEIMGTGKMNPQGRIEAQKKAFKHETLNRITGAPGNLLEWADEKALRPRYAKALAGFLKARGITAETIHTEKGKKALAAGRQYAITEAQKATFRDTSRVANELSRWEKKNAFTRVLIGGTLPFKKTPVNVLKRGVEYSPVGLIKGTADLLTKVRENRMSASQAIDEISAGTVGTGLAILGYWLGSMGIVSLGGSDDEKERGFESLQGKQNYALNIGGHSYTIDWLSPAAMPFFVGAEFQKLLEEGSDLAPKDMLEAVSKILDPVLEMSFMDGVQDSLESAAYGEFGGPFANLAVSPFVNYPSQFIPSVLGGVARTVDPVRRSYYADKNNNVFTNSMQKSFQKAVAKIPYFSQTLEPYVDQWGREEVNDSVFGRLLENFVSPGYYSKETVTEVDEEIERLYAQTGEKTVLPAYAPDDVTQDKKRYNMTAKEHTQYAKTKGQTAFNTINALLNTPDYKEADDTEKLGFIEDAYKYANQVAKKELLSGRGVAYKADKWVEEAYSKAKSQKGGTSVAKSIAFRRTLAEADLGVESYDKVRTAQSKMGISYQDYADVYADVAAARKKYEDSDEKPDKIREAIYGSTKLNADQKAYMSFLFVRGDVEDADALKTLGGISYSVYEDYLNEASKITAKDENGNTVNGLAKRRKEWYIDSLPINDSQKELLKATISTSKASRSYLKYRIEVAPLTREQKSELWEHFLGD